MYNLTWHRIHVFVTLWMPPTAEVTAEVSPARSYPELFRVTGPLLSLVFRTEDVWQHSWIRTYYLLELEQDVSTLNFAWKLQMTMAAHQFLLKRHVCMAPCLLSNLHYIPYMCSILTQGATGTQACSPAVRPRDPGGGAQSSALWARSVTGQDTRSGQGAKGGFTQDDV